MKADSPKSKIQNPNSSDKRLTAKQGKSKSKSKTKVQTRNNMRNWEPKASYTEWEGGPGIHTENAQQANQ